MLSRATYCTRENVLETLAYGTSPRLWPRVDRAIQTATTNIERATHRRFHPTIATRTFDWPDQSSSARAYRLWLDENELLSITTLTSGGVTIPAAGYYLEPQKYGPPYSHLEINQATSYGFSTGNSNQRAISITGVFGYTQSVEVADTLAVSCDAVVTTITVSTGATIGVGDQLLIGTERLTVTGRGYVVHAQTLGANLTATAAATTVTVATGSAFTAGQVLLIGAEQMIIEFIAGNTLIVQRAINSTVLAVHTSGDAIYSATSLQVTRARGGTTAAAHTAADVVSRALVPGPIQSLAVAESVVELQQVSSGYARTAGSGDNERVIGAGSGLSDLRDQVDTGYRRKVRTRAI